MAPVLLREGMMVKDTGVIPSHFDQVPQDFYIPPSQSLEMDRREVVFTGSFKEWINGDCDAFWGNVWVISRIMNKPRVHVWITPKRLKWTLHIPWHCHEAPRMSMKMKMYKAIRSYIPESNLLLSGWNPPLCSSQYKICGTLKSHFSPQGWDVSGS